MAWRKGIKNRSLALKQSPLFIKKVAMFLPNFLHFISFQPQGYWNVKRPSNSICLDIVCVSHSCQLGRSGCYYTNRAGQTTLSAAMIIFLATGIQTHKSLWLHRGSIQPSTNLSSQKMSNRFSKPSMPVALCLWGCWKCELDGECVKCVKQCKLSGVGLCKDFTSWQVNWNICTLTMGKV